MKIIQPTLLLNEETCHRNIQNMVDKAKKHNCILRPHFKTHQSAEIGQWFRQQGVTKCAVSSLGMAIYFTNAGWKDITVAFPLNVLESDKVNELAKKITLNICIESLETAEILSHFIQHSVNIFIKVDAGYHRTGINTDDFQQIEAILQKINDNPLLNFKGFLQHAGHTYQAKGKLEVDQIHQSTSAKMIALKERFISEYPNLIISNGDTPTCSLSEHFEHIEEMRPGNFVFYDVMQAEIGSCSYEEIAVAMACPVVAKHPERNEIIIYGGAVHLSKERVTNKDGITIYGLVAEPHTSGWGKPIEGLYVKKLSQEHGTIHAPDAFIEKVKIGDILYILPIHSCLTANLIGQYSTLKGKEIGMYRFGF
ncbi:alanine racemase [Marivirga sp. S37H4]|uniref:Alanine racemase n=1 Tax=Marivirga aurantiaca TaxID=2802615 RepID=A0A934WVG7_9BACT|nr:alanine racemase [Marivirga aurantiaca]MBK6263783.1 alanine racemase [Marivirga aurantiaca]